MTSFNPFEDPDIAARYEAWYHTTGKTAADQEKSLIKDLMHYFPDAETILEVGCGTGFFTSWFESLGLQAYGLDRSKMMLSEAKTRYRLACIDGDASSLPFPANSFDLVTLITTLEFLYRPIHALSEALRVTQMGVILGVINRHSWLGLGYRLKGGPIWRSAQLYTPRELVNMLSNILPKQHKITYSTTIWPFFAGVSKYPWGGFIGLAVILPGKGN
jgi:ubiquinone/menaquinone biosynthesis C-methylase UbiE